MMKCDPHRFREINGVADAKYAILRSAMERTRDEHARRYKAVKAVEALEETLARTILPSEADAVRAKLADATKVLRDAEASLVLCKAAEERAKEEWSAAGKLAEACNKYASAFGLNLSPVSVIGPDRSLAEPVHGEIQ